MHEFATLNGQPSRTLGNSTVRIAVTVQGGHLTARFAAGGREVDPFFTAPWWNETLPSGTPEVIRVLRGDFFCLPFGNDPLPHGKTANDTWRYEGIAEQG